MFGFWRYVSPVGGGGSEQFFSLLNTYSDRQLPSLLTQKFSDRVLGAKNKKILCQSLKRKKNYITVNPLTS
jgi:hypothetical protein